MQVAVMGDIYLEPVQRSPVRPGKVLSAVLSGAHFRIANLECPVTSRGRPIIKTGRCFRCDGHVIEFLASMGVDIVTLANNHIRDQGSIGVSDTLKVLEAARIRYVGAGPALDDAMAALEVTSGTATPAILNYAEHEWGSATATRGGANPYDVVRCAQAIRALKQTHDHVLVIVHGGLEHWPMPTPRMVREFRFFVECGASAVVAHHTHIISAWERYLGAPILYGLGNLAADSRRRDTHGFSGLLATLSFGDSPADDVSLHVTSYDPESGLVDATPLGESGAIATSLAEVSAVVSDPDAHAAAW